MRERIYLALLLCAGSGCSGNPDGPPDGASTPVDLGASLDPALLGTWGISSSASQKSIDAMKPAIRGLHISGSWDELETAPDQFDWKSFDAQFATVIDANALSVGFDVLVGPNSPAWIYCAEDGAGHAMKTPTCAPPVHVTGQSATQSTVFPYYLDPYYRARYYNVLQKVADHVATFPQAWRDKILYWQSAEGSTGDEGPYKGTLVDQAYAITDPQWDDYKHEVWRFLDAALRAQLPTAQLLLNTGNNGGNFDWMMANIPCGWIKSGSASHEYSYVGEINEYNRGVSLLARPSGCNRVRGEFQDVYDSSTWKKAPAANTYVLTLSALATGLDMLNLTGGSVLDARNTSDLSLYDTFSRYGGVRQASASNRAFVYFRDVPDMADVQRFPEATFGALYTDPAAFAAQAKALDANPGVGAAGKAEALTRLKLKFFNPARAAAITSAPAFVSNAAVVHAPKFTTFDGSNPYGGGTTFNIYDEDFGLDMMPDNYGRFMKQLHPNETSIGQWRIGSDKAAGSRYGRYARSFDVAAGKTELVLDVDGALDGAVGMKNLRVWVTYFDDGGAKWALRYASGADGAMQEKSVTNGVTGTWKTATWVLPAVRFDNRYKEGDLGLAYVAGGNTIFGMIEIETTRDAP